MSPCHFGEHMQECGAFQSNIMFKCPKYYCVRWAFVCDGKWDCPGGYDEGKMCNDTVRCFSKFQCKGSKQCIHIGDVCDGKADCPQEDDEVACALLKVQCSVVCKCLLFTISCSHVQEHSFRAVPVFPYSNVVLKNCTRQFAVSLLGNVEHVSVVSVTNCCLKTLCTYFPLAVTLQKLDFSMNNIVTMSGACFQTGNQLIEMNLTSNLISVLHKQLFAHMDKLLLFDVSHNFLGEIETIPDCLTGLVITGNHLHKQTSGTLTTEAPLIVFTDFYPLCCIVSQKTICLSAHSWYNSCSLLLDNILHVGLFLAFSLCSIKVNIVCYIVIQRNLETNKNFKNIVKCTTAANLLGNSILLIPSATSFHFGDQFPMFDEKCGGQDRVVSQCFLSLFYSILCLLCSNISCHSVD